MFHSEISTKTQAQLKKITEDYYLYLLNELQRGLHYKKMNAGEVKAIDLRVLKFKGFLELTKNSMDKRQSLLIDQEGRDLAQEIINQINASSALKADLRIVFEKLQNLALLSKIIAKNNSENALNAYETLLMQCKCSITRHRNPDWDAFYTAVSMVFPFIGGIRALYSFFKRGFGDFAASNGEVMFEKAKYLLEKNRQENVAEAKEHNLNQYNSATSALKILLNNFSLNSDVFAFSLIEQGANPNTANNRGDSLLHLLVKNIKKVPDSSFEKLIRYGADINIKNAEGYTPLRLLMDERSATAYNALLLIKLGANPNTVNKRGDSLLHRFVKNIKKVSASSLEELISYGADINIKNAEGYTPLRLLMEKSFAPSDAMLLVRLGADPHTKNSYGKTLLEIFIDNKVQNCEPGLDGLMKKLIAEELIKELIKYCDNTSAASNVNTEKLKLAPIKPALERLSMAHDVIVSASSSTTRVLQTTTSLYPVITPSAPRAEDFVFEDLARAKSITKSSSRRGDSTARALRYYPDLMPSTNPDAYVASSSRTHATPGCKK